MSISIREADAAAIDTIRALFREYQQSIGTDLCFQNFEKELAALPGDYASPRGSLLIAEVDGGPAGCIALRPLRDSGTCEMKRLYVRPEFRSIGLGRELTMRIIAAARGLGYEKLYLDTLPTMTAAQRLYEQLGFVDVPAYYENPVAGSRYLCLTLRNS